MYLFGADIVQRGNKLDIRAQKSQEEFNFRVFGGVYSLLYHEATQRGWQKDINNRVGILFTCDFCSYSLSKGPSYDFLGVLSPWFLTT